MPVRLRLSLHGRRNNRIFHLVATDLRKRRDAKPIELLGIYDPRLGLGQEHKTMHWSVERILYWLEKGGAQPSKPVVKLLEKGGIIPPNSKYHPSSNPPVGSSEASPPPRPPLP
ncbi:ribosomal protein S16 domain-containing protein [Lactarius quietus]|nr:ribosomal protein S16 domain-containing protein [Lactarius quietus]